MKSLIKSAVIIGQVLALVMGDGFTTAGWEVPERYSYLTYRVF